MTTRCPSPVAEKTKAQIIIPPPPCLSADMRVCLDMLCMVFTKLGVVHHDQTSLLRSLLLRHGCRCLVVYSDVTFQTSDVLPCFERGCLPATFSKSLSEIWTFDLPLKPIRSKMTLLALYTISQSVAKSDPGVGLDEMPPFGYVKNIYHWWIIILTIEWWTPHGLMTLPRLMSCNNCFSKIISNVFPPRYCISSHLNAPDQHTEKPSSFMEVPALAHDQLIKCIWLVSTSSILRKQQGCTWFSTWLWLSFC